MKKTLIVIGFAFIFFFAFLAGSFYFSADYRKNLAEKFIKQGEEFEKKNDFRQALIAYQKSKIIFPGLAESHLHLGLLAKKQENQKWAKVEFAKVLKIDKQNQTALYELGKIAISENNILKAQEYLNKVKSEDFSPPPLVLLAEYYIKLSNFSEAVLLLKQNQSNPAAASLLELLKLIDNPSLEAVPDLVKKGQPQIALAVAQKFLQTNTSLRDAWLYLAYAQLANKKIKEAKSSLEKAEILDPVYPYTYQLLAFTEEQLGNIQKSAEYNTQAQFLLGKN